MLRIDCSTIPPKDELNRRSSIKWECVYRTKDPSGSSGYLYIFSLKAPFHPHHGDWKMRDQEANAFSFPAVEPCWQDLLTYGFHRLPTGFDDPRDQDALRALYAALGFSLEDSFTLQLPDLPTLLHRWNRLREEGKVKHELKLIASEGKATHREYITAHCEQDGLISEGEEFIHDMLLHIAPLISRIATCEKAGKCYQSLREKHSQGIQSTFARIDSLKAGSPVMDWLIRHAEILERLLGLFVDNANAEANYTCYAAYQKLPKGEFFRALLSKSPFHNWENVFPPSLLKTLPDDSPLIKNLAEGAGDLWELFEDI